MVLQKRRNPLCVPRFGQAVTLLLLLLFGFSACSSHARESKASPGLAAATKFSTLSLGTRKDALRWSQQCRATLGFTQQHDVRAARPSLARIKDFFASSDEWLFLGGHFSEMQLYNDPVAAPTIKLKFQEDRVIVTYDGRAHVLRKDREFHQDKKVKVIFWGGCNVSTDETTVRTLRKLFGPHLLVGWKGVTGWEVLYSVMGGYGTRAPHADPHFFDRMKGQASKLALVRKSWLNTANETNWGARRDIKARFSVFDPDGQEWILKADRVSKGRKL